MKKVIKVLGILALAIFASTVNAQNSGVGTRITNLNPSTVKSGDTVIVDGVDFDGINKSIINIKSSTGNGLINPTIISSSPTRVTFTAPNIAAGTYNLTVFGSTGESNVALLNVVTPTANSSVNINSCYYFANNLKQGSTGADVVALQSLLRSKGYTVTDASGDYGLSTFNAVKSYQTTLPLPDSSYFTGYFGPATRVIVNNASCDLATAFPDQTRITNINPSSSVAGGTVVIDGVNFDGVNKSIINIKNQTKNTLINPSIISSSPTRVTFTTPNIAAGTYNLTVFGSTGESNIALFNVNANTSTVGNTVITSVTPYEAKAGDTMTLVGTNFDDVNANTIFIKNITTNAQHNGVLSPSSANVTSNKITFTVPAMPADIYTVNVLGRNGESNYLPFKISSASVNATAFNATCPYDTNVAPVSGQSYITVRPNTSRAYATGGTAPYIVNPSVISLYLTAGQSLVFPVNVGDSVGHTTTVQCNFTVSKTNSSTNTNTSSPQAANIAKISTGVANIGDSVTIIGTGFDGVDANRIFFRSAAGGETNPTILSLSSTQITFRVPVVASEKYKISVLGNGGLSNYVDLEVVTGATISTMNPSVVKPGDVVTLTGQRFDGVDANRIFLRNGSGEINPIFVSANSNQIVFKVPAIPAATYAVTVLGNSGLSNQANLVVGSPSSSQTGTCDVIAAKKFLAGLGYYMPLDGSDVLFSNNLRDYQQYKVQIPVTGVLDDATKAKMGTSCTNFNSASSIGIFEWFSLLFK